MPYQNYTAGGPVRTVLLRFAAMLGLMLLSTAATAQYLQTSLSATETPGDDADTLIVLVPASDARLILPGWQQATGDQVNRALAAGEFDASARQQIEILAPAGLDADRLIALGIGEVDALSRQDAEEMGAALANHINGSSAGIIEIDTRLITDPQRNAEIATAIAHGMDLRNYRFDRFKSEAEERPSQRYRWVVVSQSETEQRYAMTSALAQGVFTARELTNLPGSDGHPAAFAEYAREQLEPLGVEVTILGPDEVRDQGMGSLYGVSQGSQHKAHLLVMQWRGSNDQPIALVGKGNTFDTGGYNLKTASASILQMQSDKAGGAAVVGAIQALAGQNVAINVVAVVPLSQNAISGDAILPGDVLTAGDGTTIEVASTDAEGRLILADGIWYARDRFNPRAIVDIATLTGAKVTALGAEYSAVFSEQEDLIDTMHQAGDLTGELVWQMPLGPYPGIIDSRIADIRNTGTPGAQAGAIFLQHFAADTPWLHIDMASQALISSARGIHPEGGTGHGVRLLTEWVKIYAAQ